MIVHQPPSRSRRLTIPRLAGDRVAAALGRRLDDGYHYVRGVAAGGGTTIDAVVVGPGGTWALTGATLRGRFRHRNGHWYEWKRSTESWIPWDAQPVAEARLAGHRLELQLERAGLPAVVEACLITPRSAEVSWERGEPVPVHVEPDLGRLAARIGRDDVLSQAQVDRIVALLDPRQPLPRLAPSTGG
jgi:Nuclease-related domain